MYVNREKRVAEEEFREYLRLRELSRSLHTKIVKTLSRKDVMAGAKKLGMFRQGALVAGYEEELDVMMDYCLYSIYHGGRNSIHRYLQKMKPAGDELRLLQAMASAWYSVFQITGVGAGYVIFRDFFTMREYKVMDKNLSRSADVGPMLAARLIPLGSWCMTSGNGIPIFRENFDVIAPVLTRFKRPEDSQKTGSPFSKAREASFSAQIIRALLRSDAFGSIVYEE